MDRKVKLDLNTSAGIFLGYTATDKNVVYRDNVTGRFKTATHVVFDEAGMTLPAAERSPAAKVLQELGYGKTQETAQEETHREDTYNMQDEESPNPIHPLPSQQPATANIISDTCNHLQVKLLSIHASLPVRATDGSAGYDGFSAVDTIIQPKTRKAVPLDIAITPPAGCYSQFFSRSGLSLKHQVDVRAGTIDSDYTGNVQVILENLGDTAYPIQIGDKIAQLVFLAIQTPQVHQTNDLATTARGDSGFGSTDANQGAHVTHNHGVVHNLIDNTNLTPTEHSTTNIIKPFDLYLCTDPFDNTIEVEVPVKGDYPTLGIITKYCDSRQ
jgi:dUTP pyrophosphatase